MDQKFLYHALASGFSGQITVPFQHLIEVQAPSALPPTGGYSASRAEGFRYEEILSFSSASAVTTGSESSGSFNTLATATVEGLNILNVVKADRVVARLASKYSKDSRNYSATVAGSHFENLRIAGCPLKIEIDPKRLKFTRRPEKSELGAFATPVDLEECRGVERLEDGALYVPHFGRIYLAELLVTACYLSITMFRIVLGCAVEGKVTGPHASTNGEGMP
jgi:hypothetical protein